VELADGPTDTPAAPLFEVLALEWAAGGNYRQALTLLVSGGYGAVDTALSKWPCRRTMPADPFDN
jgi:hypothetical protein